MKKVSSILLSLLFVLLLAACSKDNFDPTPKTDDFLFFKLTHGTLTRELHSTVSESGNIHGLIYSLSSKNDTAFLKIQSQLMATVGNPNYSFSIGSAKKGIDIKGNYTDDANGSYSILMGMDGMTIKPGSVHINISSSGNNSKYGNYIEGSFTMTLTKNTDTTYTEPASGSFRLNEL
ncbi:MAG TPA: hypothetical protein VK166_02370 [Chitinophagaceae bacterium]|nr:hypothetical protein [Chitinophagaceae bacterium]